MIGPIPYEPTPIDQVPFEKPGSLKFVQGVPCETASAWRPIAGSALLFLGVGLISLGAGWSWGVTGALIAAGIGAFVTGLITLPK